MRILKEEKGQYLVMAALSMAVLFGFVAFATDVGVMLRQRRVAQTVADSAAIAAATEALYEGSPTTVTTGMWNAASSDAKYNGATPGTSSGAVNSSTGVTLTLNMNSNISVTGYNSPGNVQAVVSLNTPTTFMGLFGLNSVNVGATAIASNTITSNGCFYVQNNGNNANPAVTMGGSSVVFATQCGMTINGNATLTGHANIDSKFVGASGTISTGGSSSITGPESQGAPPTPDPLARLQQTANQPTVSGTTCSVPVSWGMSCSYNYQNGNLSGTLAANTVYYFDSNITNTCGSTTPCVTIFGNLSGPNGVTLYFAGNNLSFDFTSNGTVNLTAPQPAANSKCTASSNPLCGILFDAPQDGSANGTYTCSHGKGNNWGNPGELYFSFGSSTTLLDGIVYGPYMQLFVQDQGATTTMDNELVIGNLCSQAATLTVNGVSGPLAPFTRVGLVY